MLLASKKETIIPAARQLYPAYLMVKVKHSFKQLTQNPLLTALVAETKSSVKNLYCPAHPTQDSTVTLRIVHNRSQRAIEACCYPFEQTIAQALRQAD